MILQSSALTVGAKAITRGLVQTPKQRLQNASQAQIWCNSFCAAIVAKKDTSKLEMSRARNDEQDQDDDDKKEGEEPEDKREQCISA